MQLQSAVAFPFSNSFYSHNGSCFLNSGQVDSQIQVTGSILQPDVSGMIKLSHGEAYLPHDKGAGSTVNRLTANRSSLASSMYSRLASSGHVSRFFGSLSTGSSKVLQPTGSNYGAENIFPLDWCE